MTPVIALDRRRSTREALARSRRRYPRLSVACDAFYDSAERGLTAGRLEISLRGALFPTRQGDAPDTEGTLRLALDEGPMLVARVRVVRAREAGMALRFVELSDGDRLRLAAFLVRRGGLAQIPALEARFGGLVRLGHPALRRELRHASR